MWIRSQIIFFAKNTDNVRAGISLLTGAVQVSYFLKAKFLENIGKPFRILQARKVVFLLLRTN